MAARSHLSIGEVLSLLREEFPDITISKIRFLESQGLVDPERTPSGYRKFYEHDVERLRWILRQQRENFLPLKVIKGRLTEGGEGTVEAEQLAWEAGAVAALAGEPQTSIADPIPHTIPDPIPDTIRDTIRDPSPDPTPDRPREPAIAAAASEDPPDQDEPNRAAPAPASPEHPPVVAEAGPAPLSAPAPQAPAPPAAADRKRSAATTGSARDEDGDEVDSYTAAELAAAAGVEGALVKELQGFGLLQPQSGSGGAAYFDADGLEIVRIAAVFARHGVEARHLRAWKTSAEREASLFEQVIMPLLHQRNPQARRQALQTLEELASFGAELRDVLVRQSLRSVR